MDLLKWPKKNIYETVHLYYYFIKISGYAPFTIVGNIKNGITKTTPLDVFIYLSYVSTNLFVLYMSFKFQFNMDTYVLLVFGMKIVVFLSIFIGVIGTTWNIFNAKNMWKIIRNLYEIDEEVSSTYSLNLYLFLYCLVLFYLFFFIFFYS